MQQKHARLHTNGRDVQNVNDVKGVKAHELNKQLNVKNKSLHDEININKFHIKINYFNKTISTKQITNTETIAKEKECKRFLRSLRLRSFIDEFN